VEVVEAPVLRLLPVDGGAWSTEAPGGVLPVPHLGIERCFHVRGEGLRTLSIRGRFAPDTFNQVTLGYLCQMRSWVSVEFRRGGVEIVGSGPSLVRVSSDPQILVAPFLGLDREAEPFDEIVIRIPPEAGPAGVLFLELKDVSVEAFMDSRLVRGTHVRVGDELRQGTWLATGRELVGEFIAGVGEALEFGVALEGLFAAPPEGAGLEVALWERGSLLAREVYELSEEEAAWHEHALAVEAREGATLECTLRLLGCEAGEYGVWISEPGLVRRRRGAPVVLLVTSDTHRADHLAAAMGSVRIETPALDALAERGVLFEGAQAVSCITLPSHAAMLTGVHPRDLGIVDNVTALREEALTLAEVFAQEGWRTVAAVSALHLGHEVSGLSQGFERMSAPKFGARPGAESVDQMIAWLDELADQPVFAWVHVYDAHAPYEAVEFEGADLDAARQAGGELPLYVREERAKYRGEVRYVDYHLQRLLEHPRVTGGVVAFTADHGEVLGQHGIFFTHTEVYPDTLRVPLIMSWPGCPAGARVEVPVSNLGIGRSLLSAAGLGTIEFPGVDLLPYAEGGGPADGEPLYAFSFGAQSASITWRGRHLILHLVGHPIGQPAPLWVSEECQVEFYDLSVDAGCAKDLVEERHEEAARYRQLLIEWLLATEDRGWSGEQAQSPEVLQQLEALGYTGPAVSPGEGWWDPDAESEWFRRFDER
jgi:hypothetical protein